MPLQLQCTGGHHLIDLGPTARWQHLKQGLAVLEVVLRARLVLRGDRSPRMGVVIDVLQPSQIHMGVNLGGTEIGVPQHLLD